MTTTTLCQAIWGSRKWPRNASQSQVLASKHWLEPCHLMKSWKSMKVLCCEHFLWFIDHVPLTPAKYNVPRFFGFFLWCLAFCSCRKDNIPAVIVLIIVARPFVLSLRWWCCFIYCDRRAAWTFRVIVRKAWILQQIWIWPFKHDVSYCRFSFTRCCQNALVSNRHSKCRKHVNESRSLQY